MSDQSLHLTIFGASGRTGRRVVDRALDRDHRVTAFVRDPGAIQLDDDRVAVVAGDAYTGDGVREAVLDADAVVSAMGQRSSSPTDLLQVAGRHVLDAMEADDIERFVTVVGAGVRLEGDDVSLTGRIIGTALKLLNPDVLRDAEAHVTDVRSRDLTWTVVRVPRLSEAPPRGTYRTGDVTPGRTALSRGDLASFIIDVIEDGAYVHATPRITY